MRIALLADAASIHTQRWAQGLARRGFTVAIWSERAWDEATQWGIAVHRLPGVPSRLSWWEVARWLGQELKRYAPAIVHAHYVSRYGLYGALARVRPLVLSVWGADVEVFPRHRPWLTRPLLRYLWSQAQAITASSRYLAGVVRDLGAPAVTVIPFGIDRRRFMPRPPNRPQTPLRFVVNKALEPVYGIDFLLEVLAELAPELPWEGRILGGGSQREALVDLCRRLGLSDRIAWLGHVAASDLPDTLAWADLGLYPSWRESFGVAPLEMMALGRAAAGHRVGGLPEVIAEGQTGWLVAPGDRRAWVSLLTELAQAPDRVRQMGARGPEWVASRYDFEQSLDAMTALYRQVTRPPSGRA
jgi:glycosyltransferase involved in cell wall biosynthesis